jgi:hypothetical protein
VPDGAVDTLECGEGNDTVFLSTSEGDTFENDCENVNPSSFDIQSAAMTILGNATENSQSNRVDIDQNCELAVGQSNGVLNLDLCQKIKLALNENATFLPTMNNSTEIQLKSNENMAQLCPGMTSSTSDDIATDICNSFRSAADNQSTNGQSVTNSSS